MGGMSDDIRFPVLIGDVGGTNARFALIADRSAPAIRIDDIRTADHDTIDDAIALGALARSELRPQTAILALAGPIAGDEVPLTNCDWVVAPKRLLRRFGLDGVILLNDFEALSLCLPGLGPEDVDPIGDGRAEPERTRLVLGPGTGLGAGALIHHRDTWIAVPGEGGHIDLGPVTPRDFALWPHLERVGGRVSAETLLCGAGLMRLYRGLAALDGREARHVEPAAVTAAALAGSDPVAVEAVGCFVTYLGRFAGDLALVFVPMGGVYLAGGITGKIAPALKSGAFREAFLAKEPHRHLMERMLTAIITRKDPALAGIADFARRPARFGVDLTGRWWRR
jgi:glucokinase